MGKNDSQAMLPYNADTELLAKMLEDLKTAGKEGAKIETVWANISAVKNLNRSYTLNLGKFLGLVDSDSTKVWLTDFGTTLRYMSKNERNIKLGVKLPDKYVTMFKWILDANELRTNEIKQKFIETWGNIMSAPVLDRSISTFLNYCAWLGIVVYQGRGNQAKAVITELGKRILDLSPTEIKKPDTTEDEFDNGKHKQEVKLPENATYPILIKTNEREFPWDIKSQEDWDVVDSVITSIKKGWESKHKKNPTGSGGK